MFNFSCNKKKQIGFDKRNFVVCFELSLLLLLLEIIEIMCVQV